MLDLLAADTGYQRVTSLVRRDAPASGRIVSQRVDFERLGEHVLPAVDDAFCCLGTTRRTAGSAAAFRRVDLDYVVAFARLAQRAGARRFLLVSSVGASPRSPLLYTRTKGESEAAIEALGFPTVVILRPSFLIGARAEGRWFETTALGAARLMAPLFVGPLRRYAPAEATAVARTLVRAAATAPAGVTVLDADGIR